MAKSRSPKFKKLHRTHIFRWKLYAEPKLRWAYARMLRKTARYGDCPKLEHPNLIAPQPRTKLLASKVIRAQMPELLLVGKFPKPVENAECPAFFNPALPSAARSANAENRTSIMVKSSRFLWFFRSLGNSKVAPHFAWRSGCPAYISVRDDTRHRAFSSLRKA